MKMPSITFTKTARIVKGERSPIKPETVTATVMWAGPELWRALAYRDGWRLAFSKGAGRG